MTEQRAVVHYRDVTRERSLQTRLRDSERMAALGQLASGAAHEINNPLGFLMSNLRSLKSVFDELHPGIKALTQAADLLHKGRRSEAEVVLAHFEDPGYGEILKDGLEMIKESVEGGQRVGEIVKGSGSLLAESHGNPLWSSIRRNARRLSPSSPCQPRLATSSRSPRMDFTGYRKIASTCPISIGILDPSPPNVKAQPPELPTTTGCQEKPERWARSAVAPGSEQ